MIGQRLLLTLTVALALTACAAPTPPLAGFERDPQYASSARLETVGEEATRFESEGMHLRTDWAPDTVAFVGEVVAVERSPGFWSGIVAVFQRVHYRVVERLRGELAETDVVVQHPIIGPPTTEKDDPRLSSAIWCEGARLIVICAPRAVATEGGEVVHLSALHDPYRDDTDIGRRLRAALDGR